MLTSSQKESFARDGFLVVPNILSPEQVATLRAYLQPLFSRPAEERGVGDNDKFVMDVFVRHSPLRWLMVHPPFLEAMRDLLGEDFVFLRESAAHLNGFGGWHKDTTSQEKSGQKFQREDDYLMVEAGFYFQDNSEEYGGGLDVEVGSQTLPDHYARSPRRIERIMQKIVGAPKKGETYSIPSRAGDLVIFDFRVNHRATPHRVEALPPGREKLAIFMACSRNNRHANAYQNYIATRPDYDYLNNCSYPDDFLEMAREAKIQLL